MLGSKKPKKILLIIDPQNDFSVEKYGFRDKDGPLGVPGSSEDYERIAKLIEANIFDEIHISLDTHTLNHIGHKGFYKANEKLVEPFPGGCKPWEEEFTPVDASLNEYVEDYAKKQHNARNAPEGFYYCIWNTHCIEDSPGHQIVKEITDALSTQSKANVRYHIKGQNELTEMYSIFSAAVQPNDVDGSVGEYKYSGTKSGAYNLGEGVGSYEEAKNSFNLETSMNTELLANLFGDNNEIYVCGQAKTHCVKDSVLDMIKYAKDETNRGTTQQIHLINDCTSVIHPFPDDIEATLTGSGGKTVTKDELLGTGQSSELTVGGKRRTKKQKKSKKKKTKKSRKTRKNKKSRKH
jgi:nicotinamidase/pyrazinamidase